MAGAQKEIKPRLPAGPGTYILVLKLPGRTACRVGALGDQRFKPGMYLYVGSAFGPGGLRARLSRHLEMDKTLHWHIDYLRQQADIQEIWFNLDPGRLEHQAARVLAEREAFSEPVPGFGAADCSCRTHLFFAADQADLRALRKLLSDGTGSLGTWGVQRR